jgi:hypothetical protein
MTAKSEKAAPLQKVIWAKIRYYQSVMDISDAQLADYLCVCTKTLRTYEKNAGNLTIWQIESLLVHTGLSILDIIPNNIEQ